MHCFSSVRFHKYLQVKINRNAIRNYSQACLKVRNLENFHSIDLQFPVLLVGLTIDEVSGGRRKL